MSKSASSAAISVQNLTKNYGSFRAVKGVSFEVGKGQIVGFLGPNGAGKSTIMKILTCYMSGNSGEVQVAGRDVYKDALAVRRVVGYQPENVPLYDEMVVRDYLMFMAKMRGVARSRRRERIDHVVDVCGLRAVVSKLVRELSKGYRQRVGLAQALVHDPEVLVLDEPMSGLDPNQIVEIRDLLKEVGKTKTVLFSSHILQEIEKLCDRVIILKAGQIVADGTSGELTALLEGRRRFSVVLRGTAETKETKSKLESISNRVQTATSSEDQSYVLTAGKDIRSAIFELAKENDWELLEVSERVLTLEDVFMELTGDRTSSAKFGVGSKTDAGTKTDKSDALGSSAAGGRAALDAKSEDSLSA